MQRSIIALVALVAVAVGVWLFFQKKQQQQQGGGGGAGAGGAGAGAGAAAVNGGEAAVQEQVLPVEKARAGSPLYEAHSSWPKPDALPAFPEKPSPELEQAALEVEHDVAQWFSKDLKFTRGTDGSQVYLKGENAAKTVTVLVARNRVPGKFTLAFEAIFADAVSLDADTSAKRVKVVLQPELAGEIEKRGLKASPAVTGPEDWAGVVLLGETGVGQVFPFFYCYAKPKQLVGILQTTPSTWHPKPH